MKKNNWFAVGITLSLVFGVLPEIGWGVDRTWDGEGGNADWFTAANWSGDQVPQAGESVAIAGGASVVLSAESAALAALTVDASTLIFTNWTTTLHATNVSVVNAGALKLPAGFTDAESSNRIHVVCTDFSLEAGSTVNADAGGYLATYGPGAGTYVTNERRRGGGYGGQGGVGYYGDLQGRRYGSEAQPLQPGSGGGGQRDGSSGAGGGAVCIEASGLVAINGTLSANGQQAPDTSAGSGGSGGGIYIDCNTLAGSGLITVKGGKGSTLGGEGGGGRIAVHYNTAGGSWPGLRFDASPGVSSRNVYGFKGGPGSVWLSDDAVLPANRIVDLLKNVVVHFGSGTEWSLPSLAFTNRTFRIGTPGYQVKVTGDFLADSGADVDLPNLFCGGSVIVTNGGILRIHADPTNGATAYGGFLAVTNSIVIAPSSTLYVESHPTNGSTPLLTAQALFLAAGGMLSGHGLGYETGYGLPGSSTDGERRSGGGHGGKGGGGSYAHLDPGGRPMGTPSQPVPGGAGCQAGDGGRGGALIVVKADTVTIEGTIKANGSSHGGVYGGGGAGGGLLLTCTTLAGQGLITANGGGGSSVSGGGGGGRIALSYDHADPWPGIRLACSPGGGLTMSHPFMADGGTVFLKDTAILDTITQTPDVLTDVTLFIPDFTSWSVDALTLSNCTFRFGDPAFTLTVTNDLVIGQDGRLGVANLACGGNLIVTNGGVFDVYATATNGSSDVSGALVDVTGAIRVETNSWIYATACDTNSGAVRFRAATVFVATNGGFSADARGFRGGYGPGKGDSLSERRGGGYGGRGSPGRYGGTGGLTYGSSNAPALCGSGGGGEASYASVSPYPCSSGYGGGLIWIEAAGTVTLNGTLTANGGYRKVVSASGGSGGGIFVLCGDFRGAGALQVKGGNGTATTGAGGGGRIAVAVGLNAEERAKLFGGQAVTRMVASDSYEDFSGSKNMDGGIGSTPAGDPGTALFLWVEPPAGTLFILR